MGTTTDATPIRYEWMRGPDWEEAHRIDWHSIAYIPHAQAQRGSTVCGKRLTLHGEVQHDPPDGRCRSCAEWDVQEETS